MSTITFKNNRGQTIKVPGSLTLGQLMKLGFSNFNIVKPNAPLRDGYWRDTGPVKKRKRKK